MDLNIDLLPFTLPTNANSGVIRVNVRECLPGYFRCLGWGHRGIISMIFPHQHLPLTSPSRAAEYAVCTASMRKITQNLEDDTLLQAVEQECLLWAVLNAARCPRFGICCDEAEVGSEAFFPYRAGVVFSRCRERELVKAAQSRLLCLAQQMMGVYSNADIHVRDSIMPAPQKRWEGGFRRANTIAKTLETPLFPPHRQRQSRPA